MFPVSHFDIKRAFESSHSQRHRRDTRSTHASKRFFQAILCCERWKWALLQVMRHDVWTVPDIIASGTWNLFVKATEALVDRCKWFVGLNISTWFGAYFCSAAYSLLDYQLYNGFQGKHSEIGHCLKLWISLYSTFLCYKSEPFVHSSFILNNIQIEIKKKSYECLKKTKLKTNNFRTGHTQTTLSENILVLKDVIWICRKSRTWF